jgi:hypothetical protein
VYPRHDEGTVLSGDTLAAVRRQRAVLSTVADVIVAAASGKSMRVVVYGDHRLDDAFAERLTQALLARGRDCRCAPTVHGFAPAADRLATGGPAGAPEEAMIISGPAGSGNTEVCRVDIQVNTVARPAGRRVIEGGPDGGTGDTGERAGNGERDIVVDYVDPDGPMVRHLASWLAPQDRR